MKKFLVKVGIDGIIQEYLFPTSENLSEVYQKLTEFIENGCFLMDNVRTKRMVEKLNSEDIIMLVDDMGRMKNNFFNPVACELYSGEFLGDGVIMGNVLFVKEMFTEDGYFYEGLDEEEMLNLKKTLLEIQKAVNEFLYY